MIRSEEDTLSSTLPFIALHVTVMLWGVTAILGKLISYGSLSLVWHRMLFSFAAYCLIPSNLRDIFKLPWRTLAIFFGIGTIVCVHWVFFYSSVKLGDSASITLACCGSVSFFSAICEPFVLRKPFSLKDIVIGLFVLAGVLLVYLSLPSPQAIGHTNTNVNYDAAVMTGLLASFLGSLFTVLNKKFVNLASGLAISTIEMAAGSILLTIFLPLLNTYLLHDRTVWLPSVSLDRFSLSHAHMRDGSYDLIWVLVLSLLCTNITFYLSMYTLKHLSAFTVNLTGNLEPVYGIVFGAVFFHENRSLDRLFYFGACVIIVSIVASPTIDWLYETPAQQTKDGNLPRKHEQDDIELVGLLCETNSNSDSHLSFSEKRAEVQHKC